MTELYLRSGFGKVNKKQIQGMASKPEYALIRPSADELAAISDEVIQYSCACKRRYIYSFCNSMTAKLEWYLIVLGVLLYVTLIK